MERIFFGRSPRGAKFTRPPGVPFGLPGSQGSLTATAACSFLYRQLYKCILHSAVRLGAGIVAVTDVCYRDRVVIDEKSEPNR